MSDLIDRQAAIKLIHTLYPSAPIMRINRKWWEKKYKPYIESEKALERLPSAYPEPIKVSVDHAMTEEELKELKQKIADSPVVLLSSAHPERPKGKWVEKPHVYGVAYCSLCDYELHTNDTNFCPNCGADMRGEQDDKN